MPKSIRSLLILFLTIGKLNPLLAGDAEWDRQEAEAEKALESKSFEQAEKLFLRMNSYLVLNKIKDWRLGFTYGKIGEALFEQDKTKDAEAAFLNSCSSLSLLIKEEPTGPMSNEEWRWRTQSGDWSDPRKNNSVCRYNRGLSHYKLALIYQKQIKPKETISRYRLAIDDFIAVSDKPDTLKSLTTICVTAWVKLAVKDLTAAKNQIKLFEKAAENLTTAGIINGGATTDFHLAYGQCLQNIREYGRAEIELWSALSCIREAQPKGEDSVGPIRLALANLYAEVAEDCVKNHRLPLHSTCKLQFGVNSVPQLVHYAINSKDTDLRIVATQALGLLKLKVNEISEKLLPLISTEEKALKLDVKDEILILETHVALALLKVGDQPKLPSKMLVDFLSNANRREILGNGLTEQIIDQFKAMIECQNDQFAREAILACIALGVQARPCLASLRKVRLRLDGELLQLVDKAIESVDQAETTKAPDLDVIKPSGSDQAPLKQQIQNQVFVLKDGTRIVGFLVEQHGPIMTISQLDGSKRVIKADEIKTIETTNK